MALTDTGTGLEKGKKCRVECLCVYAVTDSAMGNQCQPLNDSVAVDTLFHSGRCLLFVVYAAALIQVAMKHACEFRKYLGLIFSRINLEKLH